MRDRTGGPGFAMCRQNDRDAEDNNHACEMSNLTGRRSELEAWNGAVVRLGNERAWKPRSTTFFITACCRSSCGHAAGCGFRSDEIVRVQARLTSQRGPTARSFAVAATSETRLHMDRGTGKMPQPCPEFGGEEPAR
jgi:hypothetical protein